MTQAQIEMLDRIARTGFVHSKHGRTLTALVRRDLVRMDMGRWVLTDAGERVHKFSTAPAQDSKP